MILHLPLCLHVWSEAGEGMWSKFPWKWGKGLCQLLRVKPRLPAGSTPPPWGVPSRLQECPRKSPTSSGWWGVTKERPSVGAQLSPEGGRRSRKQEDGVERGWDHLLGKVKWSHRGRSELFHPQVWTSLGTERCGRSACSLMIMIIIRPSTHPLPYDPLVPALWSPCVSLNAAELPWHLHPNLQLTALCFSALGQHHPLHTPRQTAQVKNICHEKK